MQEDFILNILSKRNLWGEFNQKYLPRNLYTERMNKLLKSENIVIITGVRRSGKSALTYLFAEHLIKNKKAVPEDFLFVNAEDPGIKSLNRDDLLKVIELYRVRINPKGPKYIIWDEIDNIKGWQSVVRYIAETTKIKQIVTSSGLKVIAEDDITALSGRFLHMTVFPLSFKEYLGFNGLEIHSYKELLKNKINIIRYLNKYIYYGGFPKYVLTKEKAILQNYLSTILYKDIVLKYSLKKSKEVEDLSYLLLSNIATQISQRRLAGILNLSEDSVNRYIGYLKIADLFYPLQKFDFSVKKQIRSKVKIYVVDPGLSSVAGFNIQENKGHFLENIVFIELLRRYGLKSIFYAQNSNECDFILYDSLGRNKVAIQVTWELTDENRNREVNGLKTAMKGLNIKEGLIVTYNQEDSFKVDEYKIKVVPIWKWLLNF
ncbi:ATP-binding protein [Candidatus Micrarchaeota archaeon]|nr:ATP-binding protein [Candidatus Micrarchaeota archaeon]